MFRKTLQIFAVAVLAAFFSPAVLAQDEKEIQLESSNGRNRRIEITRSGVYRLSNNVSVHGGDGIIITASNVTLNLNGYAVTTSASGTGRGIVISGTSGVQVKNGKVGSFNSNVMITNSINVNAESLQIVGHGLAPNNGPSEIGVQIVNSRSVSINDNNISSVNLGVFVRGGGSTGNRIFKNIIVGGAVPANNLLGICYNPAENAGLPGPRGDNIYNNHIARFDYAVAISPGSIYNVFNENVLASFTRGFREPEALTTNGGTNVSEDNLEVVLPATVLP
jgi:hypothetical protein